MTSLEIGEFARKYVHKVRPSDTLKVVIDLMMEFNIRHIPVIDENNIMGLIEINSVLKLLGDARGLEVLDTEVEKFYTPDIVVLDSCMMLTEAINTLATVDLDVLLIVNDDRIRGIYTEMDIINTDFLWINLCDKAIHSDRSIGEDITDFNCVTEDSSMIEAITLFEQLNRTYIGVIEPTSKRLKGEITSLTILKYIYNKINNNSDYNSFKSEPMFKLNLDQLIYFNEPYLLSNLRKDLYLNDFYVATMLDENGFPIRMISVDDIVDYYYENRKILR